MSICTYQAGGALDTLMLLVAGCYVVIALQFGFTLKELWGKIDKRSAKSLLSLIAVFVFCGLAGYVGKSLNFSYNIEVGLHIVLIACSVVFIATNQISVILHGLKND